MSLPTRKIGVDDVTAVGYGAVRLSAFCGKLQPDEERFKLISTGTTKSCLVDDWFKHTGKRDEIFLATKIGSSGGIPDRIIRGDPEYVSEALEKSLSRLGAEHVELYYLHRPDPSVLIEMTVRAMAEHSRKSEAHRSIRVLCRDSSTITCRTSYIGPVGALKAVRELGVAIVAYSPLGRGLLTGKYRSPDDFEEGDWRRSVPRYSAENFPNILKITDGLKAIGERHGATAGQVALAWLLAQGDDVIPIPGTTKIKYLKENLDALHLQLTPTEIAEVRKVTDKAGAANGLPS